MTSPETKTVPAPRGILAPKRQAIVTAAALVPAVGSGVWFHGARVLLAIAISCACAAAVEAAFSYVRRKNLRLSWGLLATGLILPLILPPGTPLWMVGLGTVFGVFFGQEVFGGAGHNVFHPALVGKCFLLLSWPSAVGEAIKATVPGAAESVLAVILGPAAGGMGEGCAAAVIVGAVVLLVLRAANWRTVAAALVSAAALSGALWLVNAERFASPTSTILSGAFLFGACFIATDPATSPRTGAGKWVYGCLIGSLAVLIRSASAYGTYTEATMFAVLLGNLFASAIDNTVVAVRSGGRRSAAVVQGDGRGDGRGAGE